MRTLMELPVHKLLKQQFQTMDIVHAATTFHFSKTLDMPELSKAFQPIAPEILSALDLTKIFSVGVNHSLLKLARMPTFDLGPRFASALTEAAAFAESSRAIEHPELVFAFLDELSEDEWRGLQERDLNPVVAALILVGFLLESRRTEAAGLCLAFVSALMAAYRYCSKQRSDDDPTDVSEEKSTVGASHLGEVPCCRAAEADDQEQDADETKFEIRSRARPRSHWRRAPPRSSEASLPSRPTRVRARRVVREVRGTDLRFSVATHQVFELSLSVGPARRFGRAQASGHVDLAGGSDRMPLRTTRLSKQPR